METFGNSGRNRGEELMKNKRNEYLSFIWMFITQPFNIDFWTDEELVNAYISCCGGCFSIFSLIAFYLAVIYLIYLAIQYIESLL